MIFHLEEEKYRDHASAFQLLRPIKGQENLEVNTQGKSEARLRENMKMYIFVNEFCKLFMISDELLGLHVFVC